MTKLSIMQICRRLLQVQAQAGIGFDFKAAGGRKTIPAQAQAGIGVLCRHRRASKVRADAHLLYGPITFKYTYVLQDVIFLFILLLVILLYFILF